MSAGRARVPTPLHVLGGLVQRFRSSCLALGRLETSLLADRLTAVAVRKPIFVCGLARSGSTLLHRFVCSATGVVTHRQRDYPLVFTPYWWRRATAGLPQQPPRERAHQDGVMESPDSPDALEEMLWMAFFPTAHDPAVGHVLGASDRHTAFESFYPAHVRKLLFLEGATRYAAKNNYHVARLPYLLKLFPDARFLIPVREPASHIASLMRQHQLFTARHRADRRALAFMQRAGHFEFGLDRRPMNLGDAAAVNRVLDAWAAGDEVRGWARYWALVYDHLARVLASDERVRRASLVVRFESVCDAPAATLRGVLAHAELDADGLVEREAAGVRRPDYYPRGLTAADLDVIRDETAATAGSWV